MMNTPSFQQKHGEVIILLYHEHVHHNQGTQR